VGSLKTAHYYYLMLFLTAALLGYGNGDTDKTGAIGAAQLVNS